MCNAISEIGVSWFFDFWHARCDVCAARKEPATRNKSLATADLQCWGIVRKSCCGLPERKSKSNVLVFAYYLTKWPEADQKAETAAESLLGHVVSRFVVPMNGFLIKDEISSRKY